MPNYESFLHIPKWRYIDESMSGIDRSALESFAADDTLCHLVGQQMTFPTVRTWVHDKTVVLGIQDHRLPHITEAAKMLEQAGYNPIVRNSGGLAVVLDKGILSISMVFSEYETSIDIPAGYEIMLAFVRLLFPEVAARIEAYEIVGSYCPGSYDLSIDGRKFAGISQRRLRKGIAVQVYLCVEGSGSARAELIRGFYEVGLQGEETKFVYPVMKPEVMASLSELIGTSITVLEVNIRVQELLRTLSTEAAIIGGFDSEELELYTFYLNRVIERNQKMLLKNDETKL